MREYLLGTPLYDISEPNKDQIFAFYGNKLYKYKGPENVPGL